MDLALNVGAERSGLHVDRKLLVRIVLLAALCLASAAPADDKGSAKPKARVAEPIVDLGRAASGQRLEVSFAVENQGEAPLEIFEAISPCACAVVKYESLIQAGESGTVVAILDTDNIRGATSKIIRVFTNDPANPELSLTIKAEVRPVLAVLPGYARYIVVQGSSENRVSTQTLWPLEGGDVEVLGLDSPLPFLSASFREAEPTERQPDGRGRQWRIEAVLAEDAPVGPFFDYLVVRTSHPGQARLSIPVSGYVRPILTVTPELADFGRVQVKEPVTISLFVTNLAEEDISLTEIENEIDGLVAKITADEEGRSYYLYLTVDAQTPKGPLAGQLLIHTSSLQMPSLAVEVQGIVE